MPRLGLALSVASTIVLVRALEERGLLDSVNGRIAVGWVVVEDLVTVLALVLMPVLAIALNGSPGGLAGAVTGGSVAVAVFVTLAKNAPSANDTPKRTAAPNAMPRARASTASVNSSREPVRAT